MNTQDITRRNPYLVAAGAIAIVVPWLVGLGWMLKGACELVK